MRTKEFAHKRLIELNENRNLWVDPYDSEEYQNRYIRKLMKLSLYFAPNTLYRLRIVKTKIWPENLELIGRCFLDLGDIKGAESIYQQLVELSDGKYYWGLPIDWKSTEYIFPKGSMMSTTTAEIALFFTELRNFSEIVENEVLKKIGYNLLEGLNRVHEDEKRLILGYTSFDNYKINNSNLLVAAALYEIGKIINNDMFIDSSIKITNACVEGISSNGGVPYFMNGNRYDSYHQVFSLRALFLLKELSRDYCTIYNKAIKFFKESLMDEDGSVYLSPRKNIIDMQGSAEALIFFNLIQEYETANRIMEQIDLKLKNKDESYIQRIWILDSKLMIRSKAIFTRQGELRLIRGIILQEQRKLL